MKNPPTKYIRNQLAESATYLNDQVIEEVRSAGRPAQMVALAEVLQRVVDSLAVLDEVLLHKEMLESQNDVLDFSLPDVDPLIS